ncbi:MAG: agmatine deiminase family protein [Planctomycetota bacterium]|nr:agmatine deiminase family protein [Planctomycetota bacterium]
MKRFFRAAVCVLGGGACAGALPASASGRADEPVVAEGGGLEYPEGLAIPRGLTAAERAYVERFPLTAAERGAGPPAVRADVRCPGEYEPSQGIMFAWEPSSSGITTILTTMVREVTTTGNADAYIMVDSAAEQSSVTTTLTSGGANMERVKFSVVTTDTIWIRDYGPRYIYEGSVRAVVDHTYNRPRPNDDALPVFWANARRQPGYDIPLVHGGGNYHLSGLGDSWATRLINNENPGLSEAQIVQRWRDYQNVQTTLTQPFPTSVDSTQHIDMWMQIVGDRAVIVSDWPSNPGSTQDQICDATAASMASAGWTLTRVPAFSVGGTHYTYTNAVMCNDLVLIPSYTNATVAPSNAAALAAWQGAVPGKTVRQVNCQSIVTLAGVMHCIVMHVPAPLGGANPTVYLRTLRGPETLTPGASATISWSTDDDVGVVNVDILLSTDGGATFPTVIASATSDDGSFEWVVPTTYTTQGRVRVVARDGSGNTGFGQSAADLFIDAPPPACDGDADGNGAVDFGDITAVLTAYGAATEPFGFGDADGSGAVNFGDITSVLSNWGATCP